MSEIDLSQVINVSLSVPPVGLTDFNVNNIALFTKEESIAELPDGYGIYRSPKVIASDWGTNSSVYKMSNAVFSQTPNILNGNGQLIIFKVKEDETLSEAITRCHNTVYFGGFVPAWYLSTDEALQTSDIVQAMDAFMYYVSNTATDADGSFKTIQGKGNTHTRNLYYGVGDSQDNLNMAAGYASGGMSVNFNGSNTTSTRHLKNIATISPDTTITDTLINKFKMVGVDSYPVIAGVPKVFSTGGNGYFDDVYNLLWFKKKLEVEGFNALATVSTKVPQTENGVAILKNAYRNVCEMAIRNGMIAAGAWNSPELFGDPESLKRNILEKGYYIYSTPINLQSQTEREERIAPLIQLAFKFQGAIHSSNIIVNFNY